jgi:hypothetical protein
VQQKGFDGVRTGHIGHVIYQGSSAGQFHNSNFTVKIHISDGFVALILISIIGNAAEYITVIIEIFKNKMNFGLGIVFRFGV